MSFVTLTKEQFEAILPKDFEVVDDGRAKEIIYQFKSQNPNVVVRLYSTVDIRTGQTRDIGQDAIRIVFWDLKNDHPVGKGKKILRVEAATTIQERILKRIIEFLNTARNQNVIDSEYIRAILNSNAVNWMDFAQSLSDSLEQYGKLTDNQLAYVLGEKNPKGKPTFEARARAKDPDFLEKYFQDLEEENGNGKQENVSDKNIAPEDESAASGKENFKGNERKLAPVDNGLGPNDVDRTQLVQLSSGNPQNTEMCILRNGDSKKESQTVEDLKDNIPLIPTKNYSFWKYPFENFNPVQSQVLPHAGDDKNMVISASTSSGKTICGEFLMDWVMEQVNGSELRKIIYTSPLKSLSTEKFMDWQKRFPNRKIIMLTGDTLYSTTKRKEQMEECNEADIIICTTELLDSCTRRGITEKYDWIRRTGLLIVDESHILATSRGHAVETGIMRFTRINPNARVLFLSATMPNVGELGNWLTLLNGKETTVIYNTWRPVVLQMHYEEYPIKYNCQGWEDYWASQEEKRSLAVQIVMSKPDEKFLVFCHDKRTGRDIVRRLAEVKQEAFFHNADLNLSERLDVESKFQDRSNGIRVLVSTSTLAWGRNLPARNVVIVGIHRGINKVDELDIIQMAGRSGRYFIPKYVVVSRNKKDVKGISVTGQVEGDPKKVIDLRK